MNRLETGARKQKRSMRIASRVTSVALEALFWERLETMARHKNMPLNRLIGCLDGKKPSHTKNLASVLRCYCMLEALKHPGSAEPG